MKVPEYDSLHKRGRALEDMFFAERERQLMETFKRNVTAEEAEQVLVAATGVQDELAIRELANLPTPQFLAVLGIFPLVAVAWCDREVAAAERRAILAAVHEMGIAADSPAQKLLENWLDSRPPEKAQELWSNYVTAVCQTLNADTVAKLKRSVIGRARKVALAAGGILGIGYKISAEEQACLDQLSAAFEPPPETG